MTPIDLKTVLTIHTTEDGRVFAKGVMSYGGRSMEAISPNYLVGEMHESELHEKVMQKLSEAFRWEMEK